MVDLEAELPGTPELVVLPQGLVVALAGELLGAGSRSRRPHK